MFQERGKRLKLEPELKLISEPEIPSESCDERGKRLKSESELESESESESESELESASDSEPEPFPKWDYRTKPFKDLVYEDFSSRYDDHPQPYIFGCARFVYRNKAQIKIDEEEAKALADYLRDSANISPFDAIPVPPLANKCGNNFPRPITTTMTDDCRALLIQLSKLALTKFNDENNQVINYLTTIKNIYMFIHSLTYLLFYSCFI
ncbi:uncharacterized protein LOC131628816 [Vicia villosa]|uniref:uncharacterized protein LOC131628816 n=1 Tax=Vicia villosa TaxID=3911 RepID=UPI00273AE7C3|nr:uncharacterized protein LOC131628816 [Vicia villosa]